MLIKEQTTTTTRRVLGWFNLVLSLILIGWGVQYIIQEITIGAVIEAMKVAHLGYILLAITVILVTVCVKAWRWQLLFHTKEAIPPFTAAFWALILGQFVNTVVPFLRLGELVRIYSLDQQAQTNKMRSVGTLVIEKTVDLLMLVLTVVILLPVIIVPDFITEQSTVLGLATMIGLLGLYLVAYQTAFVLKITQWIANRLPNAIGQRLIRLATSSLDSLATLRNWRTTTALLSSSAFIAFLSVLTPYIVFAAFDLPFGLVEASLIHIVTTIAAVPATTPAKIGIIEAATVFMLEQFGLHDEARRLSYALIYHMVVIVPQIGLGIMAASQTGISKRALIGMLPENQL